MKDFKGEIERARAMRQTAETAQDEAYWTGYERGLRRAHHGPCYGTPEEHRQWLALAKDDDVMLKRKGDGYRDGLAALLSPAAFFSMLGGSQRSSAQTEAHRKAGASRAVIKWTALPDGRWRGERDGVVLEGASKASLRMRIRAALKK